MLALALAFFATPEGGDSVVLVVAGYMTSNLAYTWSKEPFTTNNRT